jgi:hypothetical protein
MPVRSFAPTTAFGAVLAATLLACGQDPQAPDLTTGREGAPAAAVMLWRHP